MVLIGIDPYPYLKHNDCNIIVRAFAKTIYQEPKV
jgi:hypothetical protein